MAVGLALDLVMPYSWSRRCYTEDHEGFPITLAPSDNSALYCRKSSELRAIFQWNRAQG